MLGTLIAGVARGQAKLSCVFRYRCGAQRYRVELYRRAYLLRRRAAQPSPNSNYPVCCLADVGIARDVYNTVDHFQHTEAVLFADRKVHRGYLAAAVDHERGDCRRKNNPDPQHDGQDQRRQQREIVGLRHRWCRPRPSSAPAIISSIVKTCCIRAGYGVYR